MNYTLYLNSMKIQRRQRRRRYDMHTHTHTRSRRQQQYNSPFCGKGGTCRAHKSRNKTPTDDKRDMRIVVVAAICTAAEAQVEQSGQSSRSFIPYYIYIREGRRHHRSRELGYNQGLRMIANVEHTSRSTSAIQVRPQLPLTVRC